MRAMVSLPHRVARSSLSDLDLILGLDVGGTKLAAGVVDQTGRTLSLVRAATPGPEVDSSTAVDRLIELGEQALGEAGLHAADLTAVGIASGGPLDPERGVIVGPPNLPAWIDVPIVRRAEAAFGRPAILENDANAGALASHRWGPWAGTNDLVYLTISTGIGAGALIDGRLLRGSAGNGGEVGHMIVAFDGRRCECGQRGCVEAYVSGTAIARRAMEAIAAGRPSSLASIPAVTASDVAAAVGSDALATEIWRETTSILGAVVTSVINLFGPQLVILGGGVTRAGTMLVDPVARIAHASALSPDGRAADVVITPHGDAIGVLGSAASALERFGIGSVA